MSDEAVYRTALATPGLLIRITVQQHNINYITTVKKKYSTSVAPSLTATAVLSGER